jgi:exonuclease SbcC
MSKIKQIEINNFRIFEETTEIPFLNGNEIANLVVLYGPNGYGKSSFFDAVEWSMTGDIRRFRTDTVSKNALEDKDYNFKEKIFLTNRSYYKKTKKISGSVKCILDNDMQYMRTVDKKKKKDTDFTDGTYVSNLSQENLANQYIKILSQSQIDSFLRATSDKDKFDSLSSFFLEGHKASEYLNIIRIRYLSVLKELTSLKKEIQKIGKNSEENATLKENITNANTIIREITLQLPRFQIKEIAEDVDSDLDEQNTEVAVQLKLLKDLVERENIGYIAIPVLRDKFQDYSRNLDIVVSSEIELFKLIEVEKNLLLQKEYQRKIEILKEDLKTQNKKIADHIVLQEKIDYLSEIEKKIREFDIRKESILQDQYLKQTKIQRLSDSIRNKKELEYISKIHLEDKINLNKKLEDTFYEYRDGINQKNKLLSELHKREADNVSINEAIDKNQIAKQSYEQIKKSISLNEFMSLDDPELIKCKTDLDAINLIIEDLEKQLLEIDLEYKKSEDFKENINRIVDWAELYIKEKNVNTCPLCNTNFDDMAQLLLNIKMDKLDSFRISELKNKKFKIEEQFSLNTIEKERIESIIMSFCDSRLESISNLLSIEEEKRRNILNDIQESNLTVFALNRQIEKALEFFKKEIGDVISLTEDNINNLIVEAKNQQTLIAQKLKIISNNINQLDIIKLNLDNEIVGLDNTFKKSETEIMKMKNEKDYQRINDLINDYKYDASEISADGIVSIINQCENVNKELEKKVIEYNDLLIEVRAKIEKEYLELDDFQLENQKIDIRTKLEKSKEKIKDFESEYKNVIGDIDFSEESINSRLNESIKKRNHYNEILETLDKLRQELIKIEENVTRRRINTERIEKKILLEKAERALAKLLKARNECQKYIENGVDKYFNKKTINAIYKRIEPHPDLKEIDFKVDFSKTEEAELKILAKGVGADSDAVNPVLYLSSGQINILSLSIFLAKALEQQTEIETIFMDDPIQNLSDINVLSFIDFIRTLISEPHDKQIVISTHDESFFNLLKNKLPEKYHKTKYLEFESFGILKKEMLSHA